MHSKFLEYLVEELGPEFNASDKPDKRASLTMTYHAGDARIAITLEMKTDTIATENLLGIFTRPRRPQKQSETDAAQALDQVSAVREAVRVRLVTRGTHRRVAAKRDDVPDALLPVAARDVEHLAAAGADTGQMRGSRQGRLGDNPPDCGQSAVARGASCTISHRNEVGIAPAKLFDRSPPLLSRRTQTGREEFERYGKIVGQAGGCPLRIMLKWWAHIVVHRISPPAGRPGLAPALDRDD
jgi:hypothetical protein